MVIRIALVSELLTPSYPLDYFVVIKQLFYVRINLELFT